MLTRGPVDYVVSFEETINKYNVEIYGGDKVLSRQYVAYGSMIILPPAEEVKLYYLDEKGEDGYSCYEIYEHIDWDEYIGEEKVEFGNKDGITILPPVYTEETIKIRAVFAPLEPTTSPWWEIIESCEKGTYKSKYPIGTQKAVEFAYKGKTYTGILEVVDQDYDVLEDGSTAHLTLILKNAFERTRFRIGTSQKWYYDPENPELFIDAPLAGGWTNDVGGSGIYTGLKGIIFSGEDSSILNDHIKTVLKKTDFGPIERDAFEYFPTKVLPERIWTPSALEMGVLTDINEEMEEAQQGGDGTKGTYAWFTTNASRIKTYNDVPTVYFTRTWKDSWRFFGVNDDGGYGLNIINSAITNDTRQLGLRSYDPAGIIFGICL
jgi:hypothetical protein